MKRLLKTMATTVITLVAMQANAIQVTYSFRVNSSGPSIYPCNAGLLTKNPYRGDKQICYTEIDHKPCNGECVGLDCEGGPKPSGLNLPGVNWTGNHPPTPPGPPKRNNCVCTTQDGRENGNYLHGDYRNWGDVQDPHVDVVSGGSSTFNKMFGEVDAYNRVLEKLAFNLGSELYTAKYFVDICYRGSQIDYSHFDSKWNILAEASVTDYGYGAGPGGNPGYTDLSELKHKAYVICTVQNKSCEGGNCNDQDWPISSTTVAQFNDAFLDSFTPTKADYKKSSDWEDPTTGTFNQLINENSASLTQDKRATKFCKVRYVFEETNGLTADGAKHRKWQKHGADVCTHTKIEMDYLNGACNGEHCDRGDHRD